MKVDTGIGNKLATIPETVRKMEAAGYDGVRTAEMNHDPFSTPTREESFYNPGDPRHDGCWRSHDRLAGGRSNGRPCPA